MGGSAHARNARRVTSLLDIERATLAAWRARETQKLDGWVRQADGGVTGRPNAAAALALPADLGATLTRAADWYAARNLPLQIKAIDGAASPADIAAALCARGFIAHTPTLIMAQTLAATPPPPPGNVRLDPEASPDFAAVFAAARTSTADHAERWGLITRAPQPKAHAIAQTAEGAAAIGLCIVTGQLAGLYAMRTPPAARRRGLAGAIVAAFQHWAHAQGACTMYLQVEESNSAAVALYQRAGFTTLGRYRYWRKPA